MSLSDDSFQKYADMYRRDPTSRIFAAYADGLRERGELDRALTILQTGVLQHPEYPGGFLALGKALLKKGDEDNALAALKKAAELAPDNVQAQQLLSQTFLRMDLPDEALRAQRMALFLAPQNKKAAETVAKLEQLSVDDYDEDLFQMKPLPQAMAKLHAAVATPTRDQNSELRWDRQISYLDALLIRGDLAEARRLFAKMSQEFAGHAELEERRKMLELPEEPAETIRPLLSREKQVVEAQIRRLQNLSRTARERANSRLTKGLDDR